MFNINELYKNDFVDETQLSNKKKDVSRTYKSMTKSNNNVYIKRFEILSKNNPFNKKIGNYISIDFKNIKNTNEIDDVLECVKKEISYLLKRNNYQKKDKVLVVGLGNDLYISDALGPKAIKNVTATSHLKSKYKNRSVSTLIPGVMGSTGLESSSIVQAIVEKEEIDFVIVIDSLATRNINRLYNVIQLSDTGINPGSGVENKRKEISKEVLGVPVICLGVATVVDCASIVVETLTALNIEFDKNTYEIVKNICMITYTLAVRWWIGQ